MRYLMLPIAKYQEDVDNSGKCYGELCIDTPETMCQWVNYTMEDIEYEDGLPEWFLKPYQTFLDPTNNDAKLQDIVATYAKYNISLNTISPIDRKTSLDKVLKLNPEDEILMLSHTYYEYTLFGDSGMEPSGKIYTIGRYQ